MTNTSLWSVAITTTKSDAERIADSLETLWDPAPVSVAFHEDNGGKTWTATAHYGGEPNLEAIKRYLSDQNLPNDVKCARLPDVDWVAKSLEHLSPITTKRFFVSGSHHADQAPSGKIPLTIEAGQAFGTGHHETTLGCLRRIEDKLKSRQFNNVLDMGTGTGVLALAVAKLCRQRIIASDIDPIAIEVARANAKLNTVSPYLKFVTAKGFQNAELKRCAPYDLIIANILARPLVRLAPDMRQHISAGGSVLLSGLLSHQEPMVLNAYLSCGFRLVSRLQIGDWVILDLCR